MQISLESLDFINTSLIEDKSRETITQELLQAGYSAEYITAAFTEYDRQTHPSTEASQIKAPLPGVNWLLSEAWSLYLSNFWRIIGAYLLSIVVYLLSLVIFFVIVTLLLLIIGLLAGVEFTPQSILQFGDQHPVFSISIVTIFAILLVLYAWYMYFWGDTAFYYVLAGSPQKVGIINSFKKAWGKNTFRFFWTQVILISIIIVGLLFFGIPGLIFFVWFSSAFFIFTEENLSGADALLKSKKYVDGRFLSVLWRYLGAGLYLILFLIFYSIINYISERVGIGLVSTFISTLLSLFTLFLYPLIFMYTYVLFRHLKQTSGAISFNPSKKIRTLISLSVLIIPLIFAVLNLVSIISIHNLTRNTTEPYSTFQDVLDGIPVHQATPPPPKTP